MPLRDSKTSLVRSRSFGGLLNSKSTLSTPSILGHSFRSPQPTKKATSGLGFSFSSKKPKQPKVPRPERALLIFQHVKQGLGECIAATDTDVENMRASEELSTSSTGQARLLGLEKQIKAAERYKKKLEFHLSKIEELEDHYKLHEQLREGVKTMAKAYATQCDTPKKSSLLNVKSGYKECSQVMCAVEAQLESMLGTFHCQMQGLIGFARMVPGDVYEVVIRHGTQKWRCKGRIGLTQQTWDSDSFTFKALVGDVFNIKASELRSLTSVTLGHKNCEIKDLFSSHPQLMTVSLNTNGSIKLNLVCTWNPLDGVDESYSPISSVATRVAMPKRRVQSMYIMGSDSMSDLNSTLSSPDASLHLASPRQPAIPGTNFHLASFMSPIAASGGQGRNYAIPDYSTPHGPSARPKSIAVMGTIDELAASGYGRGNPSIQQQDSFRQSLSPHYDIASELRRDLASYTPRSYGKAGNDRYNPLSMSERDLSIYSSRAQQMLQNPHFDIYSPPPPPLHSHPPFSPEEESKAYSPHGYGSQPHLTAMASANSPQYVHGHAHSPYMSANGPYPYSPRPFSYTEANRFDLSDLADVLNNSSRHLHHPHQYEQSPTEEQYHNQASHAHRRLDLGPNHHQHSQPHTSQNAHAEMNGYVREDASLEAVMTSFKCTLEEYQGQYPELSTLEEQVHYLDRLLKKHMSPHSPKCDDAGISIEDALNAFDFLETEEEEFIDGFASKSGPGRASSLDQLEAQCTSLSPESTARTSDSGIECLASRLNEDHHGNRSRHLVTTGNSQVDRVLVWHLAYCERLLLKLGGFTPLKCKELRALEKLKKQADIIEHLVNLAKAHPGHIKDLQPILSAVTRDKQLKRLWVLCCTDSDVLLTSVQRLIGQLHKSYTEYLKHKSDVSPSIVFRTLVSRILDVPGQDPTVHCPSSPVTLHQAVHYFNSQQKCDVHETLQKLAGELWLTRGLKSPEIDEAVKTLATLRGTLPPPECLRAALVLLTGDRPSSVKDAAASYLQSIQGKSGLRRQAIQILKEALEEPGNDVRAGACTALKILSSKESIPELVYLCHQDPSLLVQQRAKEALCSFGEEGRQAFHDSQLESHGFQGVTMYL